MGRTAAWTALYTSPSAAVLQYLLQTGARPGDGRQVLQSQPGHHLHSNGRAAQYTLHSSDLFQQFCRQGLHTAPACLSVYHRSIICKR